jgi:hypothetical protein
MSHASSPLLPLVLALSACASTNAATPKRNPPSVVSAKPEPKDAVRTHGCEAPHDSGVYYCLGARGAGRLAAELVAHQTKKPHYEIRDVVLLVGELDMQEAVVPLRDLLRNPRKDPGNPSGLHEPFLLGDVAHALADLGDASVAPDLVTLARAQEEGGTIFDQTLEALVRLDPVRASAYARGLASRIDTPRSTWGQSMVRKVLPIFEEARAVDMMPTLVKWTEGKDGFEGLSYAHAFGEVTHARLRLGDGTLAKKLRKELGERDRAVPAYPEHFVDALGDHPDDVPALVRFAGAPSPEGWAAYEAIDRYARTLEEARASKSKDLAALEKGATALVKGLRNLTAFRDHGSTDDAGHTGFMFSPRLQVRHHASLARLGDAESGKKLLALVDGPTDHASAWIAAEHALALGLVGAPDKVAKLMLEATKPSMSTEIWEARIHLVDRAAKVMGGHDPRWVTMIFDTHPTVQQHAIELFVRGKPAGACKVAVAALANLPSQTAGTYLGGSHDRTLRDGLLALTFAKTSCAPELRSVVMDTSLPRLTRGLSLQVLAMLRDPSLEELVGKLPHEFWEHVGRAREIAAL